MKYFILSLFCITPFINITAAQAQDMSHIRPSEMVQDRSYMANPRYEAMVRAAMTNMSDTFRFERFRNLYVDTRQYDPLGDDQGA